MRSRGETAIFSMTDKKETGKNKQNTEINK